MIIVPPARLAKVFVVIICYVVTQVFAFDRNLTSRYIPKKAIKFSQVSSSMKNYIFVGGLHHGGTSLVHSLLAAKPHIASLLHSHVSEDEGQHLQQVWPRYGARKSVQCAPFSKSLCLGVFQSIVQRQNASRVAARLNSAWQPYFKCRDPRCITWVEKDPDVGSLLLKAFAFPSAHILAVMRHPFALARFDGYATTRDTSSRAALGRWAGVWPPFLVALCKATRHYTVLRYESIDSVEAEELLDELAYDRRAAAAAQTFRRLKLHGSHREPVITSALIWAWARQSEFKQDPVALRCERTFFELTGYSLLAPYAASDRNPLICSGHILLQYRLCNHSDRPTIRPSLCGWGAD